VEDLNDVLTILAALSSRLKSFEDAVENQNADLGEIIKIFDTNFRTADRQFKAIDEQLELASKAISQITKTLYPDRYRTKVDETIN